MSEFDELHEKVLRSIERTTQGLEEIQKIVEEMKKTDKDDDSKA